MERVLIFIKHHLRFAWTIIDFVNGQIFRVFYMSRLEKVLPGVFADSQQGDIVYRRLFASDVSSLYELISTQPLSDLKYFNPHGFDIGSLSAQIRKPSFLMMGSFKDGRLVGYFFLRFFANRKCFVGRLIDKQHRGISIGTTMNFIMYETAWRMNFRCLSTISRNNIAVMKAHARNRQMIVIKDLRDDYLLVEFVRETP